jgi:shikimate kinase
MLAAPVFLVGMMGAGKSSVGARVAARARLRFVDLDREIERSLGEALSDYFVREGERAFRVVESRALREVTTEPAIIATGGGTPCDPANLDFLLDAGRVVYLRAKPETLAARLAEADRPLLRDVPSRRDRLAELLATRRASYEAAHEIIDTDGLSVDAASEVVAQRLGLARG